MNIKELVNGYQNKFNSASETPRLDVELLIAFVIKQNRAFLYAHPEYEFSKKEQKLLTKLFKKRVKGIPVAQLIKEKEFWDFTLKISNKVLTPRPETELLVSTALEKIPKEKSYTILDLGTGSGAIALAVAKEKPKSKVVAVDKSRSALKLAKQNAQDLNLTNIEFKHHNWQRELKFKKIDLVLSNPPYIESNDPCLKKAPLKFEQKSALASGKDGLRDIRKIVKFSQTLLKDGGWLVLEHGATQKDAVQKLLREAGYKNIETKQDLAGLDRITIGQK